MKISVLLVDDHKMLREGIKQLLEFDDEIVVSNQASSGAELQDFLSKEHFDVVVLDINLPDVSGIDLISFIKTNYPNTKVLMLTVHNDVDYLMNSLEAGANGYILKDSSSDDLINAIKTVHNGERYVELSMVTALNSRLLQRHNNELKAKKLTKRENQILTSIAEGKSNKDIAEFYDISERTVKNHITNIFNKIDVTDRTPAAVFAIRNNLVRL